MTGIVDTSPAPEDIAPEEIESLFDGLADAPLDDADWIAAEFASIIAANFDAEPPDIPGPPVGLPARWPRPGGRPRRSAARQRLTNPVMAGAQHRRQRSPPHM